MTLRRKISLIIQQLLIFMKSVKGTQLIWDELKANKALKRKC